MNCPRCNSYNMNGARFCSTCGMSFDGQQNMIYTGEKKTSGKAITSFILSLVGLFVGGLVCDVLGIIFSAMAFGDMKKNPQLGGKGFAIAGLVISIVSLAVILLATIILVAVIFSLPPESFTTA